MRAHWSLRHFLLAFQQKLIWILNGKFETSRCTTQVILYRQGSIECVCVVVLFEQSGRCLPSRFISPYENAPIEIGIPSCCTNNMHTHLALATISSDFILLHKWCVRDLRIFTCATWNGFIVIVELIHKWPDNQFKLWIVVHWMKRH